MGDLRYKLRQSDYRASTVNVSCTPPIKKITRFMSLVCFMLGANSHLLDSCFLCGMISANVTLLPLVHLSLLFIVDWRWLPSALYHQDWGKPPFFIFLLHLGSTCNSISVSVYLLCRLRLFLGWGVPRLRLVKHQGQKWRASPSG